jgi:hypothetical protein
MSERTTSGREVARQLGFSHTAIQKAEIIGRITREPDGAWDIPRVRRDMAATALPGRSPLALPSDATPLGRLMLARLALKVEAQRIALDRAKGRLMDIGPADQRLDAIAGAMRDPVLNWPARVDDRSFSGMGRGGGSPGIMAAAPYARRMSIKPQPNKRARPNSCAILANKREGSRTTNSPSMSMIPNTAPSPLGREEQIAGHRPG